MRVLEVVLLASVSLAGAAGAQTDKSLAQLSDDRTAAKVQLALTDAAFRGSTIDSAVRDGVVTLTGNVHSVAERELAGRDAGSVAGVKAVLNNLMVGVAAAGPVATASQNGPRTVTVPVGTAISVRLGSEIDTKRAKIGDTFRGTTTSAVQANGLVLIPTGTGVTGSVVDSRAGGRFSGSAVLSLRLVSVRVNGPAGVQDTSVATDLLSSEGPGKGGSTAARTGGGALLGGLLGAVAGGGTGAAIGAAGGGAAGAGSSGITGGKQIDLKPEQLLQFRTSTSLDVTVQMQNGTQVLPAADGPASLQTRPAPQ